jgi:hypothetical protein
VDAASPGDTIIVMYSTYTENIDIDKANLTIEYENGAELAIIEAASPDGDAFRLNANYVNVSGFTVTGATCTGKAGIYRSHSSLAHRASMNN